MDFSSSVVRKRMLAVAVAVSLGAIGSAGFAQAQEEQIFGRQLMTEQERTEYRDKMRNAKTKEERDKIRAQHHEEMKARAKARGVTLPDDPPPKGMGYGRGGPAGKGPGGGGPGGGGPQGPGGGR